MRIEKIDYLSESPEWMLDSEGDPPAVIEYDENGNKEAEFWYKGDLPASIEGKEYCTIWN